MAIKAPYKATAEFSMASMTDVIFLLLIFFMVTSTFVLPTALDVNLPQSASENAIKPQARVFITADSGIYATFEADEPAEMDSAQLMTFLQLMHQQQPDGFVAVYADEAVTYGRLVEVLDAGAKEGIRMVLATRPAPESVKPSEATATSAPSSTSASASSSAPSSQTNTPVTADE